MIFRLPLIAITAVIMLTPATASPKDKVDPAAFPELAQDVLLPVIIARLKHELPDPQSIRDFVMCPAASIHLKDGKPESWGVELQFNAKNAVGGYTGIKAYGVLFKRGQISGPVASASFVSNAGFAGIINRAIDRQFEHCSHISDEAVQAGLRAQ